MRRLLSVKNLNPRAENMCSDPIYTNKKKRKTDFFSKENFISPHAKSVLKAYTGISIVLKLFCFWAFLLFSYVQ